MILTSFQRYRAVSDLGLGPGINDAVLGSRAVDQLLAVGREVVVGDPVHEFFRGGLFNRITPEFEGAARVVVDRLVFEELGLGLGEVDKTVGRGFETEVVPGLDPFRRDDPTLDAVEVDLDHDLVIAFITRTSSSDSPRPGRKRRRLTIAENHDIGQRHVEEDVILIDKTHDRVEAPVGEEKEIAAVGREAGLQSW